MGNCYKCKVTEDLVTVYKYRLKDGTQKELKICKPCNRIKLREPMRKLMARKYKTPEGKKAINAATNKWKTKKRLATVNG